MTAIVRRKSESRFAVLVRKLHEWLSREREEIVVQTTGEEPEVQRLTPAGIAKATAELLWAQRGALRIDVEIDGRHERGPFSSGRRRHLITIPGGITIRASEDRDLVTLTSPDGETQVIDADESRELLGIWSTIQAINALETLGIAVPEEGGAIRRTQVARTLASSIAKMLERADFPVAPDEYEALVAVSGVEDDSVYEWETVPTRWLDVGGGVYLDMNNCAYYKDWNDPYARQNVRLMTVSHGVVMLPYRPFHEALERRKRASFANALGIAHELPMHLPAPRGNAQATRVLQLCREAVAAEPELADGKGTPIAPLVNQHLPRLMQKHAEAARTAPADQLAAIDAELMEGIERVRLAVDEALQVSANARRDALRTELRFLEQRHPAPGPLDLAA